jgi:aerobic-type carbon monoxide dehydrogenase small subunit (CoxS/CutS family)
MRAGVSGACIVLVDGGSVRACLMVRHLGKRTNRGNRGRSRKDKQLSDLQRAPAENHGLQSGYCTPGSRDDIEEASVGSQTSASTAVARASSSKVYLGIVPLVSIIREGRAQSDVGQSVPLRPSA